MPARRPRIGILTGGGDCPGLNAVIRAVVKSAHRLGYESLGFLRGYEGLVDPVAWMPLDPSRVANILTQGGTILGSSCVRIVSHKPWPQRVSGSQGKCVGHSGLQGIAHSSGS
jgi:6-phosphofructokinase